MSGNNLIRAAEMAGILKCSLKTFNKYVRLNNIPFVPLGRSKLFNPAEVERHLKSLVSQSIAPAPESFSPKPQGKRKLSLPDAESKERYERQLGV